MRRGKRKLAILLAVSLFAGILQPMPTTHATEDAIVVESTTEAESVAESEDVVIVNEVVEEVITVQTEEVVIEQISEETITEQTTEVKTSEQDTQEVVTEEAGNVQTIEDSVEDVTGENATMQTTEDSVEDVTDENTTVQMTEEVTTEEMTAEEETTEEITEEMNTEEETTEEETTMEEIDPIILSLRSYTADIDVWDLGAEQFDSTQYNNMLTEDVINSWFPGVEAGTKGVNITSFQVTDEDGNVLFGFNDGGYSATHRLRTKNTNLTRFDNQSKSFGGVTYNGFIYSNKVASSDIYIEMYAEAGDVFTFAVSSSGSEAEYVFEAPSGEKETQIYDATEAGTLMTFYASETGSYKLYTTKEKLVVLRAYVEHADAATDSVIPDEPSAIAEYVLDSTVDLTTFIAGEKNDGDTEKVGTKDYFTIMYSESSKIDLSTKTFEDEYQGSQRINFGDIAAIDKNAIKFTTSKEAAVKVWWVEGGNNNRQITLLNEAGESVAVTSEILTKNATCISTLNVPEAGTYYLGSTIGNNYIFRVEVIEGTQNVSEPEHDINEFFITEDGVLEIYYGNGGNVVIPDSVTVIGANVFRDMDNITSVQFPENLQEIGDYAFYNCNGLTEIVIPEGVKSIGGKTFASCSNLSEITMSQCDLSWWVFEDTPIEILNVRASVEYIYLEYYDFDTLQAINVEEGNEKYVSKDGVLYEIVDGGKKLIKYPQSKEGESYEIDEETVAIEYKAFSGNTSLIEVIISNEVTSIGENAFANMSSLEEVTLPYSTTSIEADAFFNTKPKIINVRATAENISSYFYSFSSLEAINVESGSTKYTSKDGVLYEIVDRGKKLIRYPQSKTGESYEIDSETVEVSSGAFKGNTKLKKIVVPEGITKIADGMFGHCSSLEKVVLPESLTEIGSYAFYKCKGLTEVVIPNEVTSIGEYAFYESNVKKLELGRKVTNIGLCAFKNMGYIQELTIPDNDVVLEWDGFLHTYPSILNVRATADNISSYFYSFSSLKAINVEEGNTKYTSKDGVLYEIVDEGKKLLCYPQSKTGESYEIDSETVEVISGVFSENKNIKKIVIPEGIMKIEYKMFYNSSIEEVVLPESLTEIGSHAFAECEGLTEVVIPNEVTSIGEYAFYNCDGLTEVKIPNEVTNIGSHAFNFCNNVKKLELGRKVINIENGVFAHMSSLEEITLSDNITNVSDYAFYYAFYDTNPKIINVRKSAENIPSYIYKLSSLEAINVEEGNAKYISKDGVLYEIVDGGKKLIHYPKSKKGESYEIDSETVEVLEGAFSGNTKLKKIVVPEGLTKISDKMFYNCSSIEEIVLPKSVTEIGTYAFYNCDGLTELIIPKEVATIGTNAFSAINKSNFVFHCYAGSQAQKYAIDNGFTYEFIEPHEHELEEEVIVKSTCTTAGKSHFQCKTCYYYEESVVEAIGHKVSETWICDVQATCSKEGKASHHCLNKGCDYTEGSKVIEILEHQYSDWEIEKQSTVTESGYQTRRCLNCGKEEKEEIPAIPLDGNTYSLYGRVSFRLVDKERNPINNGKVVFFDSEGESYVAKSNAQGQISTILAVGSYHVQAYMGNSMLRNVRITVMPGENKFADMILSDRAKITGSLSHHEMTLEEMLEEGIDVDALENNHVVRYEVKIGFVSDVTYPFIDFLFDFVDGVWVGNINGNIPDGYKVTFHSGSDEDNNDNNNPADNHKDEVIQMNDRDSNKPYFRIENEEEVIRVYLLSEQFFLVVRGETKWLKEMFDVELFISNDMGEDIVDCQAELIIPEGISLATMVDKDSNQQIQNISRIKDGKTSSVHWYVRGDMEGTYMLDARFTGVKESYGDAFEYLFTTAAPLVVYAGSALEMTLYLQPETKFNETFKMGIEVKNVSDRNLYNVTHSILSAEQGVNKTYKYCKYYEGSAYPFETWTEDQWVSLCKQEFGPEGNVSLDVMEPGDSLIVWAETTIVYQHTAETVVKDKLPTARNIVASIAEAVAEVEPGTIKGFIADFLSTQDVYFLVDSVSVTTEPGSTTTIPYKVKFLEYERKEPKLGRLAFEALLEKAPKHLKEWITGECIDFVAGDFSDLVDTGIQIKDAVEEYNTSVNEPENFDSENDGIAVSGSSTNAQFEVYTEIIDVSMQEEMTVMSARSTQQTSDLLYIEVEDNDTVERHEDGRITFTGDANLKWVGLAEGSVAVTIKEAGTDSNTTVRVNVTENPIAYTDVSGEYVYYSQGTTFKEKTVAQIEKYGFKIVDVNEQKLIGNETVTTGMKIQKYREDELDNEVYAVVHGDVDGDGDSNIFDMMEVSEHLLDEDILSGAYLMAAKSYDNDTDDITIFDLNALSEELLVANE